MSVNIAGVHLKNPVITASGTFGFGREYGEFYDLSLLGGVTCKGLYPQKRLGNPPRRIEETPQGMLNSIGLQGPGVDWFLRAELPNLKKYDTVVIANIAGSTIDEYREVASAVAQSAVDMVELNISCPNVKEGGLAFGASAKSAAAVTAAVRAVCAKPLVVKLSPNVTDIAEIARAAESAGADALSLINTLLGMKIDINRRRPSLANITGGLSGPAVRPVAVRCVWQVFKAVGIPIVGMGGIMTGDDAVEFMLAGAAAVAVGTASFADPMAPLKVIEGVEKYMRRCGVKSVSELRGAAHG